MSIDFFPYIWDFVVNSVGLINALWTFLFIPLPLSAYVPILQFIPALDFISISPMAILSGGGISIFIILSIVKKVVPFL